MSLKYFTAVAACISLLCLVVVGMTPGIGDDNPGAAADPGRADSPQRGDSPRSADGRNEMDERILGPLFRAGYRLEEESLLQALTRNDDVLVRAGAAYALGRLPRTGRIVETLLAVVTEGREGLSPSARDAQEVVVNRAIASLIRFGDDRWVSAAANRLPEVKYAAAQLERAGLLAKAGRFEGWQVVMSKVTDEKYTEVALEQVDHFKQMRGRSGERRNLAEDLRKALPRSSERSRRLILKKINQLKAKGEANS